MTDKPLQPHEQRVITEAQELEVKMDKLQDYIGEHPERAYDHYVDVDGQLLREQLKVMRTYLSILHQRIGRFTTNQS